ncbi:prolyl oligopeptidase family serine peptidase [Enterococcus saccharolyticus]|uniref:Esterase n=1 Tax=Candidatus Enterococcus willemsii TaxID=1857215 RepID=A0ABQ6YWH7_9ENTE|nr:MULTISPECIES: alpha/beta fold hydrolase [Enterococcus]KAF1302057.1 esterase [Enterococcus sp. CU12B]MCD5002834.1 prolyl oligopeptidase family serine peptidase [Enterococcus saccharolyticus]
MKIEVRRRMVGTIPLLEVVSKEQMYEKLPLIIYYHGWQTQKELVLTQGRKLAKAGFRVILPDALNHGERKNPVSPIPSLTFWQSIQTNLFEFSFILEFFTHLDLVGDWIGVGGVSMGGMTTCGLLTHHPEISAAACVMGSPDFIRYQETLKRNIAKRGYHLPKDYDDLVGWIPAYDLATQYTQLPKRPLFFWHGTEDEKIPFEHVSNFVEQHSEESLMFQVAEERHLVKGETMDDVTEFFVAAYQGA